VTDPAHPLYGLTLPLLRVGVQERVGRIAVVRLRPDAERRIPLAATSLSGIPRPVSPARLSVAAVTALLATVAAIPALAASIYREADGVHGAQEDRDGASSVAGTTTPGQLPARAAPHGTGAGAPPAAAPGGDGASTASVGESGGDRAGAAPAGAAPDCAGGGA
jgi:hypothetical protein